MKIAFVGNFSEKKGSNVFAEVIKNIPKKYKWYIFGYIGDTESYNKVKKHIKFSTSYENGQLSNLLKKNHIDLALILSIWPETYSKTFFETLDQKIPVIAFDVIGFPKYKLLTYPLFVEYKKTNSHQSVIDKINNFNKKESIEYISNLNKSIKKEFETKTNLKFKIINKLLKD